MVQLEQIPSRKQTLKLNKWQTNNVESLIKTIWTTLRLFLIYLSFEYYNLIRDGDDDDNVMTTVLDL